MTYLERNDGAAVAIPVGMDLANHVIQLKVAASVGKLANPTEFDIVRVEAVSCPDWFGIGGHQVTAGATKHDELMDTIFDILEQAPGFADLWTRKTI